MAKRKQPVVLSATEFRSRCLELVEGVSESRTEIIIGKRAIPLARLVPAKLEDWPFPDLSHYLVGELGDVVTPLTLPWKALE